MGIVLSKALSQQAAHVLLDLTALVNPVLLQQRFNFRLYYFPVPRLIKWSVIGTGTEIAVSDLVSRAKVSLVVGNDFIHRTHSVAYLLYEGWRHARTCKCFCKLLARELWPQRGEGEAPSQCVVDER